MRNLLERLRMGKQVPEFELRIEAADEIERLRAALTLIADGREVMRPDGHTEMVDVEDAAEIARIALHPALTTDKDGCTVCPECKGNTWKAVRNPRLGPGSYEVRCDKCNGFGWINEGEGLRP